ncbi:acyltransferase family protein [Pseudoalteromonas tetraodonis]|uniref:acyltransferase family protein n=1 Tax=Pseudoalteromonas tetraodonis TaxID=43659 RepID=UPI003736FFD7
MKFREDINGLRAIAVIAVVLFHFNPSWMPGGFAGVDVFFVISGFLMTGIIFKGIEQENFSILKFYVARANRIIPALAILCLVTIVFGWFYLIPSDYEMLGKHVSSSISFISNIIYWGESGYFNTSSQKKWLLHTWSLSVEWQFYIIYPIVLVSLKRFFTINTMKKLLLISTLLGFVFCIIATVKWPTPAYFSLPTRAWEMMLGGLAFLYPFNLKEKNKTLIFWLGVIFILGSYVFITKDTPWPGYLAIFPVLGSFLIIQAQSNSIFISNNFFQKIGAWSYSIYLWHWPIVVAISYFSFNKNYIYLGLILSILLGFLSHKYIEKIKFNNDFNSYFSYLKCKPLYILLFTILIGYYISYSNGVMPHHTDHLIKVNAQSENRNPYKCMQEEKFPCYIGNRDNIKAIIIGDSHADAVTTSLSSVFNLKESGIIALTKSSCPFILNVMSTKGGDDCKKENVKRMEFLDSKYKNIPVFWVARTGAYLYGQSNPNRIHKLIDSQPLIYFKEPYIQAELGLYKELKEALSLTVAEVLKSHPVYLIQPTPEMRKNIPKTLAKNILLNVEYQDLSISSDLYFQRNKLIRELLNQVSKENNIQTLDPIPYLCSEHKCMATYKELPIYYDGDHMNEHGNKLLTPMFESVFN